ncbi:hypothetical protein [Actibacterium sp. D379-3]
MKPFFPAITYLKMSTSLVDTITHSITQAGQSDRTDTVKGLRSWLIAERGKRSKHNGVAKAIDYFSTPKHGWRMCLPTFHAWGC